MSDSKAQLFREKVKLERSTSKVNSLTLTKLKYDSYIQKVKNLKTANKKESNDLRFLRRYDIIEINGITKLIHPVTDQESIRYYVFDEELFGVLNEAHISTGHGGRDRMIEQLKGKFQNVTTKDILLFLSLCEPCVQKLKHKKKGLVVKPLLFKEMNSRCQVDLIDFQSQPDEDFKFIMVYQDHLTKFVVLRPLKSKTADEVCDNIIDIFTLLGAPCILQSDNGREFVNKIIDSLVNTWPNLKMVHGKPRHSQSQGSVERANQDIENMITTWMQDHKTSKWSEGLKFIQLMKNSALHSGIKRSPYEAMFGCPPRHGLSTSKLPTEVLANLETEEDLQCAIDQIQEQQQQQENEIESNGNGNPDENETNQNLSSGENWLVDDGDYLLTDLDKSTEAIKKQRNEAFHCLEEQAKRMKKTSDQIHPPVEKGTSVRIPVPDVDRGRGDARSILGVVLEVVDDGFYRIGTRNGILKQLFSR